MDATLPLLDRFGPGGLHLSVDAAVAREVGAVTPRVPAGSEPFGDAFERSACVGDDAKREWTGDAHVARVDVDLDDLLRRGFAPVLVVGHVEIAEA